MTTLYISERKMELAKDSVEFVDLVFNLKKNSLEKWEFVGNWCKSMQSKYPHLSTDYQQMLIEARNNFKKLKELETKEFDLNQII